MAFGVKVLAQSTDMPDDARSAGFDYLENVHILP
jgi:hypothetical protein